MFPMLPMFKSPFSDYEQYIQPHTTWFSTYQVNMKGDVEIEKEVATTVASNGRQLGVITEALLELAGDRSGESLDALRELHAEISAIKNRNRQSLRKRIQNDLRSLQKQDEEEYEVLKDYIVNS